LEAFRNLRNLFWGFGKAPFFLECSDNHNDDVFDQHQNKTLKTRKDDEEKHIYRVLTP